MPLPPQVAFLVACHMITQHQTLSIHPSPECHCSSYRYTRHQAICGSHSSNTVCHILICIFTFDSPSAAFLVSYLLCYQQPSSFLWSVRFVSAAVAIFTDTPLALSLSFVDSPLNASFTASERCSTHISPKLWSNNSKYGEIASSPNKGAQE